MQKGDKVEVEVLSMKGEATPWRTKVNKGRGDTRDWMRQTVKYVLKGIKAPEFSLFVE